MKNIILNNIRWNNRAFLSEFSLTSEGAFPKILINSGILVEAVRSPLLDLGTGALAGS